MFAKSNRSFDSAQVDGLDDDDDEDRAKAKRERG